MPGSATRAARAGRVCDVLRPLATDRLEIRSDPLKGRGVFARAAITAGALLEAAPVVIVPAAECPLLDRTILHDYYFRWDRDRDGSAAVALGIVSLCNHSRRPRARVRRNLAQHTLDLIALTAIAAGEEITIDYDCPLWFKAQE